jgi:hypothetical protein
MLIPITYDNSNNLNTKPSINFDYPGTVTYFNSFLPKLTGLNYSFVSTIPNIQLKRNSRSNDINLYYSSNFTIVKQIHAFNNVNTGSDLEMIIEHIPDPKNTDQHNLYMCFGFVSTTDISNSSISDGFSTMFNYISTQNITATTINQANQDNYKLP